MERIKQALDLARQERLKNSAEESVQAPGVATKPVEPQQHTEEKDFTYTSTRTVSMPIGELREKRIIINQQNSISDSYRLLRTQVLQRLNEKNWNTLAITSASHGAGKSLTAINLAISLAREVDNTVLLIDANLRSPKLDKYFDFHAEYGLSDYLLKDKSLEDLLVHPEGIPGFVILPAGRAIANSSEMLSSAKMQRLVDEVKTRYPSRIVLFDLPPILESSDTLAFIPNVDATLVIIEEGKTQEAQVKQAFQLLKGYEVIGTVLNKAYTVDRDYDSLDVKPSIISRLLFAISKMKISKKSASKEGADASAT